jgi:hypothetical protein
MAGRLDATRGRVGNVGTTVGNVSVGPQSFGIVGQGFAGPANQHLRQTRSQVQRTEQAVDGAQRGTRATARTYRDTEANNAAAIRQIQSDANTPRTRGAGPSQPAAGPSQQPRTSQPAGSTPPPSGNGAGPSARPPRIRRPRPNPQRLADAAKLRASRPKLRKTTKFTVFKNAQRASNGNIICPSTGDEIPVKRGRDGKPLLFNERGQRDPNGFSVPLDNPRSEDGDATHHFGHKPDSEYRRLMQMIEDNPGRFTHQEILNEYNNPSHYDVESPPANVSHGFESNTPGYGHYQALLGQPPTAPPTQPPGPGPSQQPPQIRRRH